MFSDFINWSGGTAQLLSSEIATVDSILTRNDLNDHIQENCHSGAHKRNLLQFTERNLPRILAAVQRPSCTNNIVTSSATCLKTKSNSSDDNLSSTFFRRKYNEGNDGVNKLPVAETEEQLLMARNATAVLVKYCQSCTPTSSTQESNNNRFIKNYLISRKHSPEINLSSLGNDNTVSPQTSPLAKVIPVMIAVLSKNTPLPDSVALDVQRILLSGIEADHENTMKSINMSLRKETALGILRHLADSVIVAETLVSLFGSALHAKAMMTTVKDPSAFVSRWIELGFPKLLCRYIVIAMKDINKASYFFFFHEILKRGFSPNIGPIVDEILDPEVFRPLFEKVLMAIEETFLSPSKSKSRTSEIIRRSMEEIRKYDDNDSIRMMGSSSEITRSNTSHTDISDLDQEAVALAQYPNTAALFGGSVISSSAFIGSSNVPSRTIYPLLSEGVSVIYNCLGIVRRSLPPTESEKIYNSRRIILSHAPVKIILKNLFRFVDILRSALPCDYVPCYDPIERCRARRKQHNVKSVKTDEENMTFPPNRRITLVRLNIVDIIVELVLFRSAVIDEALIKTGAINILLDLAEAFPNHDMLLRNVYRVITIVTQRPAFSEISFASNVSAAIAASDPKKVNLSSILNCVNNSSILGSFHEFNISSFSEKSSLGSSPIGIYSSPNLSSMPWLAKSPDTGEGNVEIESPINDKNEKEGDKKYDCQGEEECHLNRELEKLDSNTRLFCIMDPLIKLFVCQRPIVTLLYTWATDEVPAEYIKENAEERDNYIGSEQQKDEQASPAIIYSAANPPPPKFNGTSLQTQAVYMLTRLRDIAAIPLIRDACKEAVMCNSDINQRVSIWETPNTGDRYTTPGSCLDKIVHRPLINPDNLKPDVLTSKEDRNTVLFDDGTDDVLASLKLSILKQKGQDDEGIDADGDRHSYSGGSSVSEDGINESSGISGVMSPSGHSREKRYTATYNYDDDDDGGDGMGGFGLVQGASFKNFQFHDLDLPDIGSSPTRNTPKKRSSSGLIVDIFDISPDKNVTKSLDNPLRLSSNNAVSNYIDTRLSVPGLFSQRHISDYSNEDTVIVDEECAIVGAREHRCEPEQCLDDNFGDDAFQEIQLVDGITVEESALCLPQNDGDPYNNDMYGNGIPISQTATQNHRNTTDFDDSGDENEQVEQFCNTSTTEQSNLIDSINIDNEDPIQRDTSSIVGVDSYIEYRWSPAPDHASSTSFKGADEGNTSLTHMEQIQKEREVNSSHDHAAGGINGERGFSVTSCRKSLTNPRNNSLGTSAFNSSIDADISIDTSEISCTADGDSHHNIDSVSDCRGSPPVVPSMPRPLSVSDTTLSVDDISTDEIGFSHVKDVSVCSYDGIYEPQWVERALEDVTYALENSPPPPSNPTKKINDMEDMDMGPVSGDQIKSDVEVSTPSACKESRSMFFHNNYDEGSDSLSSESD